MADQACAQDGGVMMGPDRDGLDEYFALLAGPKPDGWLELRWKLRRGVGMGREFCRPGDRRLPNLIRARATETDVYVGVALRARQDGGKAGIDRLHLVWADLDDAKAAERAVDFEPAPTMVVWSGSGGAHAYWRLREPVRIAEGELAMRRLAAHLGADPRATDAARILRPPETRNWKHDPPAPVVLDRWRGGTYALEDIVGDLSDPPEAARRQASHPDAHRGSHLDHDDPLLSIPPTIYVEQLAGRPVGRDGKARCPFHSGGDERTPSLHAYSSPEHGWYCYGCDLGGGIYQLAALAGGYPLPLRGDDFLAVRRVLIEHLGERAAA